MRTLIRAVLLCTAIALSGCIVVPVEHRHYYHCGYYRCR